MSRMTPRAQHHRAGAVAAATLVFVPSAGADEAPRAPALTQGETWWYSQSLNSVLAFRPCPERNLCARIVWHEAHDRRLADTFEPQQRGAPPANVCNYQLQAQFNRVNSNRWDGRLTIPRRNLSAGLRLDVRSAQEIRLHARAGLLFRTETLRNVPVGDARYTNCRPVR